VSMRTGKWSELSAEHKVRYAGNEDLDYHDDHDIGSNRGVVWVSETSPKIRQEFSSA